MFANEAAARLLGLGSADEVTAPSAGAADGAVRRVRRGGDEREAGRPAVGARGAGRGAAPLLVRNVIRATGEQRWLLHKATPVFDPDGSLSMVVSVIEDLTEVKRAELAQRLLAEAGQALSSSLEYEHAPPAGGASSTVPGLADWCAVLMRGDGDALALAALPTPTRSRPRSARRSARRSPRALADRPASPP